MQEKINSNTESSLITLEKSLNELNINLNQQLNSVVDSNVEIKEGITSLSTSIDRLDDIMIILDKTAHQHSEVISSSISTNVEALTSELSKHVASLVDSTGTIPSGSYGLTIVSGVVVAIVAASVAFFLNLLYWNKINSKNEKSHFSQISLENLLNFENVAVDYWIRKKTKDNIINMQMLEVKVKSHFQVLQGVLNHFSQTLPDSCESEKKIILTFIDNMFDLATGGDFESHNKKASKVRTLKILKECNKLKNLLFKYSKKIN